MDIIKSFEVDHTILEPGFYISRIDGDITTYDIRTRKPNGANVMNNITMHTMEHLMATILRNDDVIKDYIVYFGPMGCQTGFYLLVRNAVPNEPTKYNGVSDNDVYNRVIDALRRIINWTDAIPGNSEVMCGNCRTLELPSAQKEAKEYLITVLKEDVSVSIKKTKFNYPVNESEEK